MDHVAAAVEAQTKAIKENSELLKEILLRLDKERDDVLRMSGKRWVRPSRAR